MAPYRPTLQVEVALGYGALNTSPSWTAVQTHGLEFTIRRGRSTEFDQFQAATASIRLKDTDRRYDPLYSAGTYAGSLLPNVPIRITATDSGTVFPRFYGYVDSWDYDPRRNIGFTTVPATDGFKILAQKTLPPSVYQTVVLDRSPWLYWRLGGAGPVVEDLSGNTRSGAVNAGVAAGASPIRKYSEFSLDVNGVFDAVKTNAGVIISFPFTLEFWTQSELTGTANITIAEQPATAGSVTTDRWLVYYDPVNQELNVGKAPGAGGSHGDKWDTTAFADGNPHHIVIDFTSSVSDCVLYVDGERLVRQVGGGGVNLSSTRVYVGQSAPDTTLVSYTDNIGDFIIYNAELTAAEITENREAAVSPWDGDTPGERIGRILDLIGWPAALRDIDAGEVIMGPADLAGMNALAYLQLVAQSEGGRLFMSNDGKVTFHGAERLRANSTASATFSDDGSDNPYLYGSLKYTYSDRPIINEASVQRKYGIAQIATDATSIASFGTKTKSISGLLMQTEAQALSRAEQLVYRYKDPQVRVDSWTVNPQAKPAQWQQHLALELGDHVQLEVKPANVGTRDTIQMDLEQIRESATPSKYEFTLVGSPRDPNVLNYLTWGGTLSSQSWGTGVWA